MQNKFAFIFILLLIVSPSVSFTQAWKQFEDSAKSLASKGQWDEALVLYTKAKSVLPVDSANTGTQIGLLRSIGLSYYSLSKFAVAVPYLEEAKKIAHGLYGNQLPYAGILNILAASYNQSGHYPAAEENFLEALRIRQQVLGDQDPQYAQSSNNLGFFYWSIGKFDKAEPLILEAKRIREELEPKKRHKDYATTCTNLANLYRDLGQYEKAEALYVEAKEIRALLEPRNRTEEFAKSCNILADLYNLWGHHKQAESLYIEAKNIRSENKDSIAYAESCTNLFALYRDMGRLAEAEVLALEATAIYEKLSSPDDPSVAINYNNLGELYQQMGKLNQSESYFLKARALWTTQLGTAHPHVIANTNGLARLYWLQGNTAKSHAFYTSGTSANFSRINEIFNFTSEREKTEYIKNISGTADEYFSFYFKNSSASDASFPFRVSLNSRNLILNSSHQSRNIIYNSRDSGLIKTFEEWSRQREQIARIHANGVTVKNAELDSLESLSNRLEKTLARASSAFSNAQLQEVNVAGIQRALQPNEAIIEYINFRYYNGRSWTDSVLYAAVVIRKDLKPKMFYLFESKQLDELLASQKGPENKYQDLYKYTSYGSIAKQKNLKELIWAPVESYLAGIKKIYFSPSGQLHQIAFAAIPLSAREQLSDLVVLDQVSSANAIVTKQNSNGSSHTALKVYGGIDYDHSPATTSSQDSVLSYASNVSFMRDNNTRGGKTWSYLPGTSSEVKAIKDLARNKKVTIDVKEGIDATEASIKSLAGQNAPSLLHIATHGFFYADPKEDKRSSFQRSFDKSGTVFKQSSNPLMRAGLLFAGANNAWQGKKVSDKEDGIVTALEVSNLYLPKTRLVVLSACETALGEIQGSEGVYGLQRAFRMAGVPQLIMSLWKVPDIETAEFMEQFYKRYLNGSAVNDAFRESQTFMRNKYRAEPEKWAAWILIR